MDCKAVLYLFLRQEQSRIALLAIIHLCLTLCKDRLPVMYEGQVATEALVKTQTGAWWIVLGEAVPEISQNLGAYLSDCSTPYLQQLNLLAADTNGSASHQEIHQKISSWPVVNLSKWQVGMLTEMAFGFFFIEKTQWWTTADDSQKWKILVWKWKMWSESFWLSIFTRPLFPFLFPFQNKTLRYRKRNPRSAPREWEVNSALQE